MTQPALISKLMLSPLAEDEAGELVCLRNSKGSEVTFASTGLRMASLSLELDQGQWHLSSLPDNPLQLEQESLQHLGLYGPDASSDNPFMLSNTPWQIRKAELIDGIPTIIALHKVKQDERTLDCQVQIQMQPDNQLNMTFDVTADQDGVINLAYPLWLDPRDVSIKVLSRQRLELDEMGQPTGEVITQDLDNWQTGHYLFKTQNDDQCVDMVQLQHHDEQLVLRSTCPGLTLMKGPNGLLGVMPQGLPGNQDHPHFPSTWVEADRAWQRSWQLVGK